MIFNKIIPDKPSLGFLNLQSAGVYNYLLNLNSLRWNGAFYNELEKGEYSLAVRLFIKDPSSPNNLIDSNTLKLVR